jgi:hypothetical protein
VPPFSLPVLLRALAIWLLLMAAESAQGGLRRLLASDAAQAARQGGVILSVVLIFIITWYSLSWIRVRTLAGALGVGLLWVIATLAFDAGLGRALGYSWDRIAADYDLSHGALMPVGLVAMALTPLAVLWARRRLISIKARRKPQVKGRSNGDRP